MSHVSNKWVMSLIQLATSQRPYDFRSVGLDVGTHCLQQNSNVKHMWFMKSNDGIPWCIAVLLMRHNLYEVWSQCIEPHNAEYTCLSMAQALHWSFLNLFVFRKRPSRTHAELPTNSSFPVPSQTVVAAVLWQRGFIIEWLWWPNGMHCWSHVW